MLRDIRAWSRYTVVHVVLLFKRSAQEGLSIALSLVFFSNLVGSRSWSETSFVKPSFISFGCFREAKFMGPLCDFVRVVLIGARNSLR